ncbi:MAG: hypothetical protein WDM84_03895 [Bauldia sp.]
MTTASGVAPCPQSQANSVLLIVDDDPAVRNSLKFSLEIEGYAVRLFATARSLLADARLPACGCLIADYGCPTPTALISSGGCAAGA